MDKNNEKQATGLSPYDVLDLIAKHIGSASTSLKNDCVTMLYESEKVILAKALAQQPQGDVEAMKRIAGDPRLHALVDAEKHVMEAAERRREREAKFGIGAAPVAQGLTDEQIIERAELEGVATYETGWYRMTRGGLLAFARSLIAQAAPSITEPLQGTQEPVAYDANMRAIALRNLTSYLAKASFVCSVDRQAAMNCLEVLAAPPSATPPAVEGPQ